MVLVLLLRCFYRERPVSQTVWAVLSRRFCLCRCALLSRLSVRGGLPCSFPYDTSSCGCLRPCFPRMTFELALCCFGPWVRSRRQTPPPQRHSTKPPFLNQPVRGCAFFFLSSFLFYFSVLTLHIPQQQSRSHADRGEVWGSSLPGPRQIASPLQEACSRGETLNTQVPVWHVFPAAAPTTTTTHASPIAALSARFCRLNCSVTPFLPSLPRNQKKKNIWWRSCRWLCPEQLKVLRDTVSKDRSLRRQPHR